MGFFSWITSDTQRSIANRYSSKKTFIVHLITEDGRVFTETNYDGYGEFGGKDFYELVSEINGLPSDRNKGIDLVFKDNPTGEYNGNFKYPKLVEELPNNIKNWEHFWNSVPYPISCEAQGYFYSEQEDEGYDY